MTDMELPDIPMEIAMADADPARVLDWAARTYGFLAAIRVHLANNDADPDLIEAIDRLGSTAPLIVGYTGMTALQQAVDKSTEATGA